MRINGVLLLMVLGLAPIAAVAQGSPVGAPPPEVAPAGAVVAQNTQTPIGRPSAPPMPPGPPTVIIRRSDALFDGPLPMAIGASPLGPGWGAWWKNSDIVSKLQLSDEQVRKISQTYLDHRLNLIDLQANLDKQELRLQPLMDVDQPDSTKVGEQIDLITTARGKLEKENAMMMLDIRRWLSVEQWKKLKSLEAAQESKRNFFYVRTGPGGPDGPPAPPIPGEMPDFPPPR